MSSTQVRDPAREVLNQAASLQPIDLFEVDVALTDALQREGVGWGLYRAHEAGSVAGSDGSPPPERPPRELPPLRYRDTPREDLKLRLAWMRMTA